MTQKIHGFVATPDQFLTGGLPMFTATVTNADLTALVAGDPDGVDQPASGDFGAFEDRKHAPALDALIAAISIRAQPVVMGTPTPTALNFAVEHNEIFGDLTAFSEEATKSFKVKFPTATVVISKFVF